MCSLSNEVWITSKVKCNSYIVSIRNLVPKSRKRGHWPAAEDTVSVSYDTAMSYLFIIDLPFPVVIPEVYKRLFITRN